MKENLPKDLGYEQMSPRQRNEHLLRLYESTPLRKITLEEDAEQGLKKAEAEVDKGPLARMARAEGFRGIAVVLTALMARDRRQNTEHNRRILDDLKSLMRTSAVSFAFQIYIYGGFKDVIRWGRTERPELDYELEMEEILDRGGEGIFNPKKAVAIEGKFLGQLLNKEGVNGLYMDHSSNMFSTRWWINVFWRKHHVDPRLFIK